MKDVYSRGELIAIIGVLFVGVSFGIDILIGFQIIPAYDFFDFLSIGFILLSWPVMAYGCFYMAKGKGYNPIIGVLLSIAIIGPLIINLLPYQKSELH